MISLLKEPLLHFLIAGSVLFGGYEWLNRNAPGPRTEDPVRIGAGEVRWLQETFASQWGRQPSSEEANDLAARLVEEELLAREARTLGLDQNDTIVRRRLAQKLTFLVEETSRLADPDEDELRRFYQDHVGRYRTEPRLSFSHIFFSSERRSNPEADARAALASFATADGRSEQPQGDPLLLEGSYTDVDQQAVAAVLGAEFARAVFALRPGPWSGPVRSAFGVHLVQVTQVRPAELRPFGDVRRAVVEDWRRVRESETKAAYLARLRDKYGVVIEDGAKPLPGPEPAAPTSP